MSLKKIKNILSKKIAIICVVAGLLLLIVTALYATRYYHNPTHHIPIRSSRDVTAIQNWMTIHYIARSYGVPEQVLLDAVGITLQQASHQSIRAIAQMQGKNVNQLLTTIRVTVRQYKGLP